MKDSIIKWIQEHKEELIQDVFSLVRIDSTRKEAEEGMPFGKGPADALKKAEQIAAAYGFKAENMDNYVCCIDMSDNETELDVLAHLDVVPADENEWTVTSPYMPVIFDDKLYGRGVADDKGPAIAALYAMRAIKELGINLKKNVRLILGADEECGGEDIEYYYSVRKSATYTISPDADFPVVNVEKGRYASGYTAEIDCLHERIVSIHSGSKDNVIPGMCTIVVADITDTELRSLKSEADRIGVEIEIRDNGVNKEILIKGVSGHAAEPEYAVNALTAGLDIISKICGNTELEEKISGLSDIFPFGDYYGCAAGIELCDDVCGRLTISLNRLDYENGRLDCVFDSRIPEIATRENLVEVLRARGMIYSLKLKDSNMSKPHIVREDSHFIQTLLACYEEVKNKKGYTSAIGGGTYVHDIDNGVAFGPVEPEIKTNLHSFDENIPIDALLDAAVIYALTMIRLCGE